MKDLGGIGLRLRDAVVRLRSSAFVKNVLIVMSGTAVAQIIGYALTPIISRLFSPADFGLYGSFYAVVGVIAAGATLDYSQAIMLPKEKEDAVNLFTLSCVSTAVVTGCCLVACVLFPRFVQSVMTAPNVWMSAVLVVATLVSGLNQACQAWCVRVKAFKDTSASQVIRSVSSSGMQVGFGYLKGGSLGLIVAGILADVFASVNLVRVVVRDLWAMRRDIRWKWIRRLAKQYRDFPMYSASMNVINSLSLGLPVLLLTHFYGIAVAGAYAFGMRILSVPMEFVLRSLRQVLFQKAAETHNLGDRLMPLYVKTTAGLFALAFVPSLILFLWAPSLFTWIFGTQWHTAGEFARYLILWLMFMFCNLPSVLFARITRIQRKRFAFDLILLAARAMVLFGGGTYLPAIYTIILLSLVGAITNVAFIVIVGRILIKRETETALGAFGVTLVQDKFS